MFRREGLRSSVWVSFFFFQAEDGIRDLTVTGVQTCALPIFGSRSAGGDLRRVGRRGSGAGGGETPAAHLGQERDRHRGQPVGASRPGEPGGEIGRASCRKEGRSRWSPYH